MSYTIWEFNTKRFTVKVTAEQEYDLDLSWDDTGEVAERVESGLYEVFCAKCAVYFDGQEIAADYLGQCIYESPWDFRDHIGITDKSRKDGCNYASYFSDMVKQSVQDAREYMLKPKPVIYIRNN